jgi:hypothetical protein
LRFSRIERIMAERSPFTTARKVIMRNASLAGALAGALIFAAAAEADQLVLTYHGSLDRAGRYVVPGLTYERARGLHLDASFHAAFQGEVYAQPLF